ncbi:hypothetical protein [Azospirillum halopraeferens]|uniref:hypothetical protein n=1 Tax=Azospirillum halopraeferens TaxID=34010 RepID=UPI00040BE9D4|nr:hypothetical protein [Azospirillum halopraeferens]
MFFELISIISVAFAAAGAVLIAGRLLRIRLPKYVLPMVAALAMIGFTIWLRYTWAERTIEGLPAGFVVVDRLPYHGVLEPWALVFPRTAGLVVLDGAATRRNPDHPDVLLVTTRLIEEHQETLTLQQFVDCARRRRAPATTALGPDGLPPPDAWVSDDGTPLYDAACAQRT